MSPEPHFVDSFDPAIAGVHLLMVERYDDLLHVAPPPPKTVSLHLRANPTRHHAFPLIIDSVYSSSVESLDPLLVIDSGASCCISPCRHDFLSYSPSSARIKDLSGTNVVAGEGLLRWHVLDRHDQEHTIDIKGYHIPQASVHLLSPQALYKLVGGRGVQDISKYSLVLSDEIILDAPYGHANLPVLPMCSPNHSKSCFWSRCFAFQASDRDVWARSILAASNQNLTLAQKELLLWHQRLSHAGLSTVQNISRQRRDSCPSDSSELVRICDGPLLPCTYNVPSTACANLLCAACEISKAT